MNNDFIQGWLPSLFLEELRLLCLKLLVLRYYSCGMRLTEIIPISPPL